MRKIHTILAGGWLLPIILFCLCSTEVILAGATALYVDPVNGNDKHSGVSVEQAFRTIEQARDHIRNKKLNVNMEADLSVYLLDGRYELNETLYFDYRDSGSNGYSVIYKSYNAEQPVICGGRKVSGWKSVEGEPYFVASVPERKVVKRTSPLKDNRILPLHPRFYSLQKLSDEGFASYFAQLYVNGVRAERARSHDVHNSSRKDWWDNPQTKALRDGIYIKKSEVKNYTNPEDVRLLWLELFKTMDAPLEEIIPCDEDEVILKMKQPAFLKGTAWQRIQPQTQFFIVNALEELDEPGEWYLDQKKDLVYYYPYKRDGDLNMAKVYAPRVEGLMKIDGTPMRQVHHIRFDGITFQHGNWTDPKDNYLGLSQAEIYKTYTSEFPGQVILNYADDVAITNCTVRHMGSCGIQLYEGCDNVLIEGNITYDTTGAGITVGRWWHYKWECPPESICTNTMIRNNVVRNTGRDYWQGTGINIFTAYQCKVYHNDISDTAYTALHARTGDSAYIHPKIGKLEYKYNKVSRAFAGHKWGFGDGGHLYMHGRYPDSVIEGNYSLYANQNVNMEYYPDNDSYKANWVRNVSRYSKAKRPFFVKGQVTVSDNYSDKPPDSQVRNHTLVKNDQWPKEAQDIMDKAGLQPGWKHLADKIYGHENLAFGKPCWVSSQNGEAMAAKAGCDDNWNTFWHTKIGGDGQAWWKVDLGNRYVIQRVTIIPRQDMYQEHARRNIEVQASNDAKFSEYVVLAEQNEIPWYNKSKKTHASNMWEKFINIPEGYRYLRVKADNEAGSLNFSEFAAYGYPVK